MNHYQAFAQDVRVSVLTCETVADWLGRMSYHDVSGHSIGDTYGMVTSILVYERGASLDDCLALLMPPARKAYERDKLESQPAWSDARAIRDITFAYEFMKKRRTERQH